MPTGATSDLVPVRKDTKRRLARLKGDATYDALLRKLLDLVPEGDLRRELLDASSATTEARERPPEKQLLIARLAEQRWKELLASGRIVERGPRLFTWTPTPPATRGVSYAVLPRRGFSP